MHPDLFIWITSSMSKSFSSSQFAALTATTAATTTGSAFPNFILPLITFFIPSHVFGCERIQRVFFTRGCGLLPISFPSGIEVFACLFDGLKALGFFRKEDSICSSSA
ncbi:hypothetical protein MW887_011136 [Aspergillus wentii]|nr:hypothetical protein MW887_011136 [Aspergillus wentii]